MPRNLNPSANKSANHRSLAACSRDSSVNRTNASSPPHVSDPSHLLGTISNLKPTNKLSTTTSAKSAKSLRIGAALLNQPVHMKHHIRSRMCRWYQTIRSRRSMTGKRLQPCSVVSQSAPKVHSQISPQWLSLGRSTLCKEISRIWNTENSLISMPAKTFPPTCS